MHSKIPAVLSALALGAASSFVFAADVQHNHGAPSSIDFRAMQAHGSAATVARSGEFFANPYRAYPPSCLNSPIPAGLYSNDPAKLTTTIQLSGDPLGDAEEQAYTENDTVTIFRVPCGPTASAVLVEIDRPSTASTVNYPVFPGVVIGTGYVPRVAADPNTFFSNTVAYDPVVDASNVYVFENYIGTTVNYNQALSVTVNNLQSGAGADVVTYSVPAYNASAYAANSQPLPISGYQSGNFYDATRGGEGIQIEVGDVGVATSTRSITIAWYTFDDSGTPYWLYGQANFTTGATSVSVPMYYGTGGGFAGDYTSVAFTQWGNVTVNFPDCNTMKFTYASNAGLPEPVPVGSGSKTWTRLTQLNGLTCQ